MLQFRIKMLDIKERVTSEPYKEYTRSMQNYNKNVMT
jgi:hypothetical protein